MSVDLLKAADRKKVGILEAKLKEWRADPAAFVRDVCHDTPDKWQEKALKALASRPKMALKACKGPGKTRFLAWAIFWWMFTRWHANIVAMSITSDNLRDNLWSELARVLERSPILQLFFIHKGEQLQSIEHPKTWWCSARSFPQNADLTQQANTIAGLHGLHPMVVCDEVGDYPDGVVVAAEGIFANDVEARLLLAGNPTRTEGPLYRVCNRDRATWWVMEITGDPNDPDRATRISLDWANQMINDWGPDNPWVLVNVYGQFPPTQANKLIGPELVEKAMGAFIETREYKQEPRVMALDVARYGDDESVLTKRQGRYVHRQIVYRESDLMSLADAVAREVGDFKPTTLFVDQGGVGAGVVDRLQQLGVNVTPVDFGGGPTDDRFDNRHSEMWWNMAEWLKLGAALPNDTQLRSELLAPNYEYKAYQKRTCFRIESKKELKKRGVGSPDRADSLALTFAAKVAAEPTDVVTIPASWPDAFDYGRIRGGTDSDWDPLEGF